MENLTFASDCCHGPLSSGLGRARRLGDKIGAQRACARDRAFLVLVRGGTRDADGAHDGALRAAAHEDATGKISNYRLGDAAR